MAIEIKNSIVSDVVGTLYDKMGVNDYTSPKKVKAQLKDCAFSNDLIVNVSSGGGTCSQRLKFTPCFVIAGKMSQSTFKD